MPTLPDLAAVTDDPVSLTCDALVVGAFADGGSFALDAPATAVDEALDARLSGYLNSSGFKGGVGELAVIPGGQGVAAVGVAVVGLGDRDQVDAGVFRRAAGSVARRLSERATLGVALHHAVPESEGAAAEGLLLGSYRFTTYKSDPKPSKLARILFVDGDDSAARARVDRLRRDEPCPRSRQRTRFNAHSNGSCRTRARCRRGGRHRLHRVGQRRAGEPRLRWSPRGCGRLTRTASLHPA